jgi:lipopolysaccharide/colanic/teichoic acid biosynthesis glycosyltransferase
MSLVGPRPPTFDEVVQYQQWYRRRLTVTPGITCLWQVEGRSRVSFEQWMRMDARYVQQNSIWNDLKLIARTIPAVLLGRGAS